MIAYTDHVKFDYCIAVFNHSIQAYITVDIILS